MLSIILSITLSGVKGEDGGSTDDVAGPSTSAGQLAAASKSEDGSSKQDKGEEEEEEVDETDIVLSLEDLEEAAYKEYEAGSYSPPRITDPEKLLELRVSTCRVTCSCVLMCEGGGRAVKIVPGEWSG